MSVSKLPLGDNKFHFQCASFCHLFKVGRSTFWTPDASRSGSYKITLVIIILYLFLIISDPFFSETALTIFMKLCTMLDNDKRKAQDSF